MLAALALAALAFALRTHWSKPSETESTVETPVGTVEQPVESE